jgi:hypothetical protein
MINRPEHETGHFSLSSARMYTAYIFASGANFSEFHTSKLIFIFHFTVLVFLQVSDVIVLLCGRLQVGVKLLWITVSKELAHFDTFRGILVGPHKLKLHRDIYVTRDYVHKKRGFRSWNSVVKSLNQWSSVKKPQLSARTALLPLSDCCSTSHAHWNEFPVWIPARPTVFSFLCHGFQAASAHCSIYAFCLRP